MISHTRQLLGRASVAVAALLLWPSPGFAQNDPAADVDAVVAELASRIEPEPGGLTANEVARLAVQNAPSVRGAQAARQQAEEAAAQARSAFIPQLTLTAGYTRLSEVGLPPLELPGLGAVDNPFPQILNVFLFRATAAIPVTDYFLTILPAYEGAERFAEAAEAGVELQGQQIAFRAREAYFNHIRARGGLAIASQAVTTLEATLEDVESLVGAGVLPRADGLQLRARLASARAAQTQARGAVRLTERALRTMLHLPEDTPVRIGEDLLRLPAPPVDSEDALIAEARRARPEVRALRALVGARESLATAREGALFPRVLITAQADMANPNQRIFPQSESFNGTWAVGVALSWSPTSLPGQLDQLEQAQSQVAQARADLEALEDGLAIEATQAWVAYESARESIESSREGLIAAHAAFEDRRRLLAAGAGTTTELAGAQLELTQAQLAFVNAHISLHVAVANIERVAGRTTVGGEG